MSKILQFLVTVVAPAPSKGEPLSAADKRRFYPVVAQPDEAKDEKAAEAFARKAWAVGADEKIKVHVETFKE